MISVFDTSIAAYNLGNQIIMDAVINQLDSLYANEPIIRLPVEDISTNARRYNNNSLYTFVGGTNILNGDIRHYRQWDLNFHNALMLKNCVLMGCGWFQYEQEKPTKYTQWILSRILSKDIFHSVRDEYTKLKLDSIGIKSINTGCPTLWNLDPNLSKINGKHKSESCIIAFTDYNQDKDRDLKLFEIVKSNYSNIYLFVQGTGDLQYIRTLGLEKEVKPIKPRLKDYDAFLNAGFDFIGTRLHAGIRALQKGQRSIIIGIDNRALEMSKDFWLPVVKANQLYELDEMINNEYNIHLNLPLEDIARWKSQFFEPR